MLHGVKLLLATTVHNKWSACEGTQDTASTALVTGRAETAAAAQFLLSPLHCTPFMDQMLVQMSVIHVTSRLCKNSPELITTAAVLPTRQVQLLGRSQHHSLFLCDIF
jgi:hypothetical protein